MQDAEQLWLTCMGHGVLVGMTALQPRLTWRHKAMATGQTVSKTMTVIMADVCLLLSVPACCGLLCIYVAITVA